MTESLSAADVTKCQLSGFIADKTSGEGLSFASIQISSIPGNTFTKGTISEIDGSFKITDIPPGKYLVISNYMGYENARLEIELFEKKHTVNIALTKKNFTLNEVEITAEQGDVEHSIDKTTINITKNTTLSAGNAVDVMQSLPSVDFDMEGKLLYRGSDRVTVLLNGKKSELVKSLDQIPADQIRKIEIINNPSAKYEAEGMSGIINIVLKSGSQTQKKTTVMLYAGLPETYGGTLGYSGFSERTSFFANGSYKHKTKFQTKEHLRENYGDPNAPDYYQYDRQDEILNDVMINTGFHYSINDRQQVGLSLVGSGKFNTADRSINYQTLGNNDEILYNANKDIDISLNNYSIDGNLDYQYDFMKKGRRLEANLHYSLFDQMQEMDNVYYPENLSAEPQLQNTDSEQLNKEAVFAVDYIHPLNDSMVFEGGYRFSGKDLLNDFTSEAYDPLNDQWEKDTALANTFNYLQNIHAVYINFEASLRYFDLQAGFRGEHTSNDQIGSKEENYFNLFPSITVSKQLGQKFNAYLTANRRINRPTIKMLNPYTNEYADILNMHIGNPDLKPEYVNSYEAGSRFILDKVSGSASVYFRNIDQAISRVKSASNDSALLVTFMNLDNARLLGGEFSFSWDIFKWWRLNAGANVFYTTLQGEYGPNPIDRSHTAWTGNLSGKFKLPWKIGLQINAYYRSELPDVMGTYMARYYMDMALDRKILNDKGKLIFRISDVFNTYRYGLDLVGVDENGYEYSQRNRRKNESQYFILSFVYNIDGKEKQQKKENFFLEDFGK